MSLAGQYSIHVFLWNNEGDHDKVWGYFTINSDKNKFFNFWGRRGAKLTWKEYPVSSQHLLSKLTREKCNKGYKYVNVFDIENVTPGFIDEFEKNFSLARLFDSFHAKHPE